jgi:putative transposase
MVGYPHQTREGWWAQPTLRQMPEYRRAFLPRGMFFFTVVTYHRTAFLCKDTARQLLSRCIRETGQRFQFRTVAFVLLPDHLHCIWELPEGDSDYSKRWALIKKDFTRRWSTTNPVLEIPSASRLRRRESTVWQRRFWEHTIRSQSDLMRHVEYIHYNPVRHGLVLCPHAWPYSTFRRWVSKGYYTEQWCCRCQGRQPVPPDFSMLDTTAME